MKLNRIALCGFRSFGVEEQDILLGHDLILIEAANSQGKTALAEGIEFLLTGRISRRELMGSARAEFEECLRNVHLPEGAEVYVEVDVSEPNGESHTIRRELLEDFTRDADCKSRLLIDGSEASLSAITALGIRLSEPPIEAPVLLQHNLRYLLQAAPQKRADYFKAILAMGDVEDLRNLVAQLDAPPLSETSSQILEALTSVTGGEAGKDLPSDMKTGRVDAALVQELVLDGIRAFADREGISIESDADSGTVREALSQSLSTRREAVFPVQDLLTEELTVPSATIELEALEEHNAALAAADTRLAELIHIFDAVLAVPDLRDASVAIDCPVCGTPAALSADRVAELRRHVEEMEGLQAARDKAGQALSEVERLVGDLRSLAVGTPAVADWSDEKAAELEESADRLAGVAEHLSASRMTARALQGQAHEVEKAVNRLEGQVQAAKSQIAEAQQIGFPVAAELGSVAKTLKTFSTAHSTYRTTAERAVVGLEAAVRAKGNLSALESAILLIESLAELPSIVMDLNARQEVGKRLRQARKDLERAATTLLDERFDEMSNEVRQWWIGLRPGEIGSFDSVRRRGSGKRFFDLKAELKSDTEGSAHLRDAVAVFSDSQLNALGLATFLARCQVEQQGVVVLDDPVTGSDKDHRFTFAENTIGRLLDAGHQVVVTTFDRELADKIATYHRHRGFDRLELTLESPVQGTTIRPKGDQFELLMLNAYPLLRSGSWENRRKAAQNLRSAAEHLAKQILVASRRRNGESAQLSDYDRKVLSELVDKVAPYVRSPDELGKWKGLSTLNSGVHDGEAPSANDLAQAHGNLRRFKQDHKKALGSDWPHSDE